MLAYGPLLDEEGRELLRIRRVVGHWKGGLIVEAEDVPDRTHAEFLRGLRVYVPRSALPEPGEEEYYHVDLVGLRVFDEEGRDLGRVLAVHDFGGGEILEYGHDRRHTHMILFTRDTVPEVDLENRRIVVRPPAEVVVPPAPAAEGGPETAEGEEGAAPTATPEAAGGFAGMRRRPGGRRRSAPRGRTEEER
ncbi:Ribosome maturation factor RimM [bacterium HR39]|nr:Ribosome maturation factor RimM [bacterium HR39]